MISTSNIAHHYSAETQLSFPDIQQNANESILILGPSGCGKSTLLHILAGLLKPTQGEVTINDKNITKLSSSELDALRGKEIGIVFQVAHFVKSLSVRKNLEVAQNLAGLKTDVNRIKEILASLNIEHKLNEKVTNLSIGEQQRVSIARALLNKPSIILADEPTSSLDDKNCDEVINLLEDMTQQQGTTLIIVTHDQRLKNRFKNVIEL